MDHVSQRADDGNGLDLFLIEGKKVVLILEQHDGLEGDLFRDCPVAVGVPGQRRVLDRGVGNHLGGIEQAKLDGDAEFAAQRFIEIGFLQRPVFERRFDLELVAVKKLIDASLEAGDHGGFLVGEKMARVDEQRHRSAVAGDDVDAPLVDDDAAQDGVDGHGRAVPGVVGSHDGLGAAVCESHAEGNRIVLPEKPLVEV